MIATPWRRRPSTSARRSARSTTLRKILCESLLPRETWVSTVTDTVVICTDEHADQIHSLLYTTHQHKNTIGSVSANPQTNGNKKSTNSFRVRNNNQKMRLFSMSSF